MDQATFLAAEEHLDNLAAQVDELLESDHTKKLRDTLVAFSKSLGERYGIDLDVVVRVFDRKEERGMPLLATGLSTVEGCEPYRTWSDCTFQRYVANGKIQVVPHDRCPVCWGEWAYKFEYQACPCCEACLGEDVKVLLDRDICPSCEEGKLTAASPTCDSCGYEVNPAFVVWG